MALSGTTSIFRGRVTQPVMVWINRASGTLIAGFGAYAVWRALG